MAVQHNGPHKKVSLEEFFVFTENDPEHSYELINGRIYIR